MIQVVCVRTGTLYGPEYVAILRDMVARNLAEPFTFWCLTDQPEDIEGVERIAALPRLPGWWQKLALFSPHMPWSEGDRVVYFDLDVCITGRLENLPKGIIRDWHLPGFNSSVMVWDHGEHRGAWDLFTEAVMDRLHGDQDWITEQGGWDTFPPGWCVSYRSHAMEGVPDGTKVVCFHGRPKPHECAGWVEHVWKIGGDWVLPKMDGANVSPSEILSNVEANCKRALPWFIAFPKAKEAVVVGGGPSLRKTVYSIREKQRRGALVISVNGSANLLRHHGIQPDAVVLLDAREENIAFLDGCDTRKATKYYLASQCHPAMFDKLEGCDVTVWHCGGDAVSELMDILKPYDETHPIAIVPGGGTVGLRAINLCWISGFKRVHVYGMDSSYAEGAHHAYCQPLNDGDRRITVRMGEKTYEVAPWMVRQAEEFKAAWAHLKSQGVRLFVHGTGLIPDIAKALT